MSTITRGGRGRTAWLTASILAVVGLGLAGCQTGAVEDAQDQRDAAPSAAQVERTSAAWQSRYEGLAEHYAQRPAAGPQGSTPVADRLEAQAGTPVPQRSTMVADRREAQQSAPSQDRTEIENRINR